MDKCKKYQKLIEKFDTDELSLKQEEDFCRHINSCADCREELEIYYIFSYGLHEEENDNLIFDSPYKKYFDSYDFTGLVDRKLKDSEIKCRFIHRWRTFEIIRNVVVYIFMIVSAIIFFMIKYN